MWRWHNSLAPPLALFDAAIPGWQWDDELAHGILWNAYARTHDVKGWKYAWTKGGRPRFATTWFGTYKDLVWQRTDDLSVQEDDDD